MKVNLCGGLGNQMFQYAFGRSLSLARNTSLFFDRGWCDAGKPDYLCYAMDLYDVEMKFNGPDGPMYMERGVPFDKNVSSAPVNSVFHGYWQTEKYFAPDVIRKELSRPKGEPSDRTNRIADAIGVARNNAFVHVRRGDYLTPQVMQVNGCLPLKYYTEGMRRIEEQAETKFFIFSNDEDWCRQTFSGNIEIVNSSEKEKAWDIWLMSLCSHAVIANSSFSWWGAWLNPKKERIVIAPKQWFVKTELDSRDIVPERWTRV